MYVIIVFSLFLINKQYLINKGTYHTTVRQSQVTDEAMVITVLTD